MNDNRSLLEALKPTESPAVMDLVEQSGIDVTPWRFTSKGEPVERPKANPQYCYEWSFGSDKEPVAFCVWHEHLKCSDSEIYYEDNLRNLALKLESVRNDKRVPRDVRSRSVAQAKRARSFDSLIQSGFRLSKPIRVILLIGEDLGKEEIGWDSSKVKFRRLDSEPWQIVSYSLETGNFKFKRGYSETLNEEVTDSSSKQFVDQFEAPSEVGTSQTASKQYIRKKEVRLAALVRSNGFCELCGEQGFKVDDEKVYLETHHVIPLSEAGYDEIWNVVALCPNDHKKAHFSISKNEIRKELIEKLVSLYPDSKPFLEKCHRQ